MTMLKSLKEIDCPKLGTKQLKKEKDEEQISCH
jgi:hypothetical protein